MHCNDNVLVCAADLLHMLTMAHQDLPPDLIALARKDSKFRIGSSGKRGGRGGGSAGGGANRRRPVGGAGLGFEDVTLPGIIPSRSSHRC